MTILLKTKKIQITDFMNIAQNNSKTLNFITNPKKKQITRNRDQEKHVKRILNRLQTSKIIKKKKKSLS